MSLNRNEQAGQEGLAAALEQLQEKGLGSVPAEVTEETRPEPKRVVKGETDPRRVALKRADKAQQRAQRGEHRNSRDNGRSERDERPAMNTCPVDGNLKLVEREITTDQGTKVVPYLTCKACSDRFNADKQATAKAIARGEAEAGSTPNKFEWVLNQINLEQFEVEKEGAEANYRAVYEQNVLPRLEELGYVESFEWNESFPKLRYTRDSNWDEARAVERELKQQSEVRNAFATMRKAQERLRVAPGVKADLEAKLTKHASADAKTEASDETTTEAPAEVDES